MLFAGALTLAGCGGLQPADFANDGPTFRPELFFEGEVSSEGVIEGRSGAPTGRVATASTGRREGDALVITQTLTFDDGRRQERVWRLRRLDDHRYEATATDIVGVAIGEAQGSVFRLSYTLALRPGNPLANVGMLHWMYLQDDGTMVNRVRVTKLGVTVAQVTERFRKVP